MSFRYLMLPLAILSLSLSFAGPAHAFVQETRIAAVQEAAESPRKLDDYSQEELDAMPIAQLEQLLDEEELYAAAFPPIVQDYEPSPAIWKLSDDDTAIYMFGTIHILPPGFKWRSAALDAIIANADELVLETTDEDMDVGGFAAILELLKQTKGKPDLSDRILPQNKEKLRIVAEMMELPIAYLDRMPVWMMPFILYYDMAGERGSVNEYGVEMVLERVFAQAGKPVRSIEDGMAVFRAMGAMDDTVLLKDLNDTLSNWSGKGPLYGETPDDRTDSAEESADFFASDHDWARGKAEKLSDGLTREDMGDSFYQILLVDRNTAWAEWLEQRLDQPGNILLAVGAGHFAGDDSVQIMLEKRGLKAERIH